MFNALVIGASGGVGSAVSDLLEEQGAQVVRLSRSVDGLDVSSQASVDAVLGRLSGPFDLIFVAIGVLSHETGPEKSLKNVSEAELQNVFAINAIGPALILRHAARLLPRQKPATIAVLSARVGSIEDNHMGGWYSYRASKAALNQIIKSASIELARTHKHLACVALHPGTVQTKFTENYRQHASVAPDQAADNLLKVIDKLDASDTGTFYDWSGAKVPW